MVRRKEYSGLSRRIFDAVAEQVGPRQVQAVLARKISLPRAAISARLRGETSWKAEEVETVAEWLGFPVGALYGGILRVPVMGAVAANPTPGLVREAGDEPEEYLEVPQCLRAFTVYDTSMTPLARPGQRVLVDPTIQVVSGDLVVARVVEGDGENTWMFKRYERQKVGKGWKALLQSIAPGFQTVVLPEYAVKLWKVVGLWLMPSPRWQGMR